jgi:hypothetical protein
MYTCRLSEPKMGALLYGTIPINWDGYFASSGWKGVCVGNEKHDNN